MRSMEQTPDSQADELRKKLSSRAWRLRNLYWIKDKNGKVLEEKEVRIEGHIKRYDSSMVGTLLPDPKDKAGERRLLTSTSFADLSAVDPDLQLRWSEGIEVILDTPGFEVANIDLLEVRAVPAKIQ